MHRVADFTFTRRQVREALGWGDTQLWTHLRRLMELEFLRPHRGRNGQTYVYELLYQGEDPEGRARLLGLIEGGQLRGAAEAGGPAVMTATIRGVGPTFRGGGGDLSGAIRGAFGQDSGGIRDLVIAAGANGDEGLGRMVASDEENRGTFLPLAAVPSYPRLAHMNGHGR